MNKLVADNSNSDDRSTFLTIGQLAKAANVHVETIRYYQKRGLLPKPEKPVLGFTRYPMDLIARLKFIKSAQHLSFRLDDIMAMIDLTCQSPQKSQVRSICEKQLKQIQLTKQHLDFVEQTLTTWIDECSRSPSDCCPILTHIQEHPIKTNSQ